MPRNVVVHWSHPAPGMRPLEPGSATPTPPGWPYWARAGHLQPAPSVVVGACARVSCVAYTLLGPRMVTPPVLFAEGVDYTPPIIRNTPSFHFIFSLLSFELWLGRSGPVLVLVRVSGATMVEVTRPRRYPVSRTTSNTSASTTRGAPYISFSL